MTREEAKELFRKDKDAYGKTRHIMKNIDKIYDDFEAQQQVKILNISDDNDSKLIILAKIMIDEEIEYVIKKQQYNIENFKDIFDEVNEVSSFEFSNKQEQMGAIKALNILSNYILNRNID